MKRKAAIHQHTYVEGSDYPHSGRPPQQTALAWEGNGYPHSGRPPPMRLLIAMAVDRLQVIGVFAKQRETANIT